MEARMSDTIKLSSVALDSLDAYGRNPRALKKV
jgi:hypothetical protein